MEKLLKRKPTIIVDNREKLPWAFPAEEFNTIYKQLPTGDYTILGLENLFIIERKFKITEFARNLIQPRFERELIRLDEFKHPFCVLEFDMKDLINYPYSTKLHFLTKRKICLRGKFLLRKLNYFQLKYKTKFIFAGKHGLKVAESLIKQVINGQINLDR